jgi:Ion channel
MPDVRGTGTRLSSALGDHPSAVLLGAQLFAVLAYPFLDDSTGGRVALGVVQPGIVLLAVYAVRRTAALSWVALLFGLPAVVFSVLEVVQPENDVIIVGSALAHVPFYFFVSYAMIRYLFHDDRVTQDELFATGAAFTVVAWGFAYLYAATQVLWPGSFVGTGGPGDRSWFDLLFLSFTTLTSVGLSDIVPVLPHARSLVMVEQVAGVLYIALVVARLVGLTVIGRRGG